MLQKLISTKVVVFDLMGKFLARRYPHKHGDTLKMKYGAHFAGQVIFNQVNGFVLGIGRDYYGSWVLVGRLDVSEKRLLFFKIYCGDHFFLYKFKKDRHIVDKENNSKWFWRGNFIGCDWEDPEFGDSTIYLSNRQDTDLKNAQDIFYAKLHKLHYVIPGHKYQISQFGKPFDAFTYFIKKISHPFDYPFPEDIITKEETVVVYDSILKEIDSQFKDF